VQNSLCNWEFINIILGIKFIPILSIKLVYALNKEVESIYKRRGKRDVQYYLMNIKARNT
jgi:hypothetical protein